LEAHPKFHTGKMNHSARKHDGGIEYHTAYGSLNGFDPLKDQEQQFFPSIDVYLGPQWEFNLGVGGAQPDRPIT
jgi:hypothetical protein